MSNAVIIRKNVNRVVVRTPGPQGAPGTAGGNVFDAGIWLKNADDGLYYKLTVYSTNPAKLKIVTPGVATPT